MNMTLGRMNKRREAAFTLVEIMIVVAIIALLAAIAIPNVLRGRTTANEASSIGNLRALISGLEMYRSVNNVYPQTANWGTVATSMYPPGAPAFGPPSFGTAAIAQTLANDTVQGFNYTYTATAGCTDAALNCNTYTLLGVPQTVGQTGTRSFFTNQTGTISHCIEPGGAAVATAANGPTWTTIDQGPTNPCT